MSQSVSTSSVSGGYGREIVVVVPINQGASGTEGPPGPPGPAYQFPPYDANFFMAGPQSGAPAIPNPRQIIPADLPSIAAQAGTIDQSLAFVGPASGSGYPSFRALTVGDVGGALSTFLSNGTVVAETNLINLDPSLVISVSGDEVTISLGPQPYQPSGFALGPFSNDQVIFNWGISTTATFLENVPGSILTCDPILTQNALVTLVHGGTVSGSTLNGGTIFGTGAFSSGSSTGTITSSALTLAAPGNISLVGPVTLAPSLQNITATIAGTRGG